LNCDVGDVIVLFGDSEVTPFGIGTFNSRTVVSAFSPLVVLADELRELVMQAAAAKLECDVSDIALSPAGANPRGADGQATTLGELASWFEERSSSIAPELPRALAVSTTFSDKDAVGTVASGAHLALVEVDPSLGTVRIEKYVAVEDCGTILNPLIVKGQIQGAVAQGIGGALSEEFIYSQDGQPLTTTLADYLIPGALDIPHVEIHHVVTPSPATAHGAKGMAEGATIPVAAVLASAIDDALSSLETAPLDEVPFVPERVRERVLDSHVGSNDS
jgi:carbon-monoxide dehydrogenase large subunit